MEVSASSEMLDMSLYLLSLPNVLIPRVAFMKKYTLADWKASSGMINISSLHGKCGGLLFDLIRLCSFQLYMMHIPVIQF